MADIQSACDTVYEAYRANVVQRLEYQLIWFRAKATVEDIQRFIYERDEQAAAGRRIHRTRPGNDRLPGEGRIG